MARDCVLYLVRVVSKQSFVELCRLPVNKRQLTSTLGYAPAFEFPGVCATLVTANTLEKAAETLYPGRFMLFLDARLLRDRSDYHLNISDRCGYFGIDSVLPCDLHEFVGCGQLVNAIDQCGDDFFGTEVVFHNPLPWSCVVDIKKKSTGVKPVLPHKVLQADGVSDFRNNTFLPYFALPMPQNCAKNYYIKNENEIREREALLEKALQLLMQHNSAEFLYFNRHLQNIVGFKACLARPNEAGPAAGPDDTK